MFFHLTVVLLLAGLPIHGAKVGGEQCLGLSLGPRSMAVAASTDPDRPSSLHVTQYAVEAGEQDWLHRVANSETEAKSLITNLLSSAKVLTRRVYGETAKVHMFALPSGLNNTSSIKKIIRHEASIIGLCDSHSFQFIHASQTLSYAYDLGTHAGLGLPPAVDLYDENFPIIWLDYNEDALSISLLDTGGHVTGTIAEQRSPALGSAHSQDTVPAVAAFISAFIETATTNKPGFEYTEPIWRPVRNTIRFVVLTGDSSPSAFLTLKAATRQVFDPFLEPGWMRDTIDPGDVVAIGAAVRAKFVIDAGDDMLPQVQYVQDSPNHEDL